MIVTVTFDNGKHIVEVSLPTHQRRKIKEFLINEFERWNEKEQLKYHKLLFAGGEWEVPKELMDKMYAEIVKSYSSIVSPYKIKETLKPLVTDSRKCN